MHVRERPAAWFLSDGGECGALVREIDWSATPLGPPERWPRSLQTAVFIVLASRQPMFVWWGPERVNLYNDAYSVFLGQKHPRALGRPAIEAWREIWPDVGPLADGVMATRQGVFIEDLPLLMQRRGFEEETTFTFSYTPLPEDQGASGGMICACTETTRRVQGERQMAVLRDIASFTAHARTADQACKASVRALATNPRDLPFAVLYSLDEPEQRFVLAAASGVPNGPPAAPQTVPFATQNPWPLHAALVDGMRVVDALPEDGAPANGPWARRPERVAVLPVPGRGVLVAGLNPYRPFDEDYRGFLSLAAGQIGTAIANARAYAEERERAERLADLNRAKMEFFANVSHEFRTPLTLLVGPLREGLARPEPALAGPELDAAYRNTLRLLRLTNSLLDFSRIEAGRLQASYQPTDLSLLTEGLASVFRSVVEAAGLTLCVRCPPLGEQVWVDPQMWEKVVLNLVSNAFKHTFDGTITVSVAAEADGVGLRVADTGIGIDGVHLPHVFERFHRVQGARSRTHEGTGIGLALVKELVHLHGGRVAVESEPGVGTVFTVVIPRGTAHLPPERLVDAAPTAEPASAAPFVDEAVGWLRNDEPDEGVPADSGVRILVADDNADVRGYVQRLLARHWTVETAPDGERALARAQANPPDLVLSDVMMPGLDGLSLLRALRAAPATRLVPVVLLSARAGEEAKVEGLEAGADDYLMKPFGAQELLARVRSQLELSRMRREREREGARMNEELERRIADRTRELVARTEELVVSNTELASFTYTVAHDLRAPLRGLHRYAEALREDYQGRVLDETAMEYAGRIVTAAGWMDALINSLLAYARVNRSQIHPVPVDPGAIFREAVRFHVESGGGGTIELEEPMPRVSGDAVLIGQVAQNLLRNACTFVRRGATASVVVGATPRDGRVRVWVRDDGIGVADEHKARIFGVFERLHPRAEYEGTGIGLAIVKRAVERMGGTVGVESEVGRGSTFWFELPAAAR